MSKEFELTFSVLLSVLIKKAERKFATSRHIIRKVVINIKINDFLLKNFDFNEIFGIETWNSTPYNIKFFQVLKAKFKQSLYLMYDKNLQTMRKTGCKYFG